MPKLSLSKRIALTLPLAITTLMALVLLLAYLLMQSYLKETISARQYQLTTVMADEIDHNISKIHQQLLGLASRIPAEALASPDRALAFLKSREEHLLTFDNGLFLFTPQGHMLAELPLGTSRTGTDFSYRDYLRNTIASRKPVLSNPYISSQSHHHPAIMFTTPIFDAQGRLLAILGGSIDLTRSPFIERLTSLKIGNGGYMYLIGSDRILISHPDRERIMKDAAPPGANRLLDRAIAGFDGTDATVTSRGLHALTSFRHLKTRNWIIAANYPLREAYAPIRQIRMIFLGALAVSALALFWGIRRYLRRMTDPIITMTRQVGALSGQGELSLTDSLDYEEVAIIGNSFNRIVAELSQEREKFRVFFEESGDAIFIVTATGTVREANREAAERYGYSREELIGMPVSELDTPEEWPQIPARIAAVMEQGTCRFESHHRRKDGSILAVEVNASRVSVEGNRAILAVVRDISIRKAADEQLHRQNEYLLALHETTLGLLSRHDVAGLLQTIVTRAGKLMHTRHCYVYLKNQAGTEMDMVFQSGVFDSFVHHPLRQGEGIAGQVWQQGKAIRIDNYRTWEHRLQDPDRDVLTAMAGVPLTSEEGIAGVLGLAFIESGAEFSDEQMAVLTQFGELASLALENARLNENSQRELAERKKAEANLRKLSVAVEQSPVSIMITDPGGTIEYVNPHFTTLTGYLPGEVLGQTPRMLKSGETRPEEYRALWETILAGGEWQGEFLNRKKDGELYWEQALIAPIRDDQGQISHFIAVKEDITERKRLENQLRHSQKMEAIGQLAGGIAHDFNNILTAIIGYASILDLKLPQEDPLKANVQQITASAERGATLTQGLLAFSRKQESNPQAADLNEIIGRVQLLLRRLISEEFSLVIEPCDGPLPVMADSLQVEQVLMNLATNARDALAPGGSIRISTAPVTLDQEFILTRGFGRQGRYAMLSFADNGQGMDEETARHVFEPFFTTKEVGKGTGLGLSIVYGIVKKHGGYITCSSVIGTGTTFQLYLPLVSAPLPPAAEADADGELDIPDETGQRTILLAEDDEITRELTRELLEQFGYRVIEAGDGSDALEKFRAHRDEVCLMILDAIMPGMKGIEVYDAARAFVPDIRVLFYSGYAEDTVRAGRESDHHIAFLAKPFMPKELLMKIREVLEDAQ